MVTRFFCDLGSRISSNEKCGGTTPTPTTPPLNPDAVAAAKKTVVKFYENSGCSGDEFEFTVDHVEKNCKYCIDTCFKRYTTSPQKDLHANLPR